jgi:hypothetical protein
MHRTIACTTILAGTLVCGGLSATSAHAFDFKDEAPLTRDLRPGSSGPGHQKARPRVTLKPSSPVVRIGAPINFELGSNVDGFAHIYVVSASGRVQVWMENVPISAGQQTPFPTRGRITAAEPTGRDDIVLIVTRERVKGFLGYGPVRTPRDLDYDAGSFKQAVRERFEDLPLRDWGYARTLVQVVNRASSSSEWDWDSGEWQ